MTGSSREVVDYAAGKAAQSALIAASCAPIVGMKEPGYRDEHAALLARQAALEDETKGHRLIAKEQDSSPTPPTGARQTLPPSPLIEPLSERELEVLRLLTTYLSSTEIAAELTIAPSTARSHIKHIYAKLDVHSRMDAVQRARELGLL